MLRFIDTLTDLGVCIAFDDIETITKGSRGSYYIQNTDGLVFEIQPEVYAEQIARLIRKFIEAAEPWSCSPEEFNEGERSTAAAILTGDAETVEMIKDYIEELVEDDESGQADAQNLIRAIVV